MDPRYSSPFGFPKIVGAYLAVNAVPDVWMLTDSPDCAILRAELIQDNHDWTSTLITTDGRYRIAATGVSPDKITVDRRDDLADQIAAIGSQNGAILLIYPTPMAALVGIDYNALVRRCAGKLRMPAVVVDPVDALGDAQSGYEQVMETLAATLPLVDGPLDSNKVALVGHLHDRNEADLAASVEEICRLVAGLGMEPVSVWLSGQPASHLAKAGRAGVIISLPCAGRAAQILSARTGARVIETNGIPVGLQGTIDWILKLGADLGREKEARCLVEREAPDLYRKVAKAVMRHFVNKDFMICTEAHVALGVAGMIQEFGGNVRLLATDGHPRIPLPEGLAEATVIHGRMEEVRKHMDAILSKAAPSPVVLIGNERAIKLTRLCRRVSRTDLRQVAIVPLGFQSGGFHHLYPAPFLGFSGTLSLIDRIVNAVVMEEMRFSGP